MMGWDPFLPSSYVRHVLNAKKAWTPHRTAHAVLKIYRGVRSVCVCVCVSVCVCVCINFVCANTITIIILSCVYM